MASYRKPYPFDEIEPAWQAHWERHQTFRTPNPGEPGFDPSKPKFYVLDMFPYPSGSGLHVGHPEGYTATDILGRARRMQGCNVLHPMGWDAFGLPAEQYAIKTGRHPRLTTQENVDNFRRQLKSLGFAYDWQREVNTTDPDYIRWTQWIFLQLYHSYVDPRSGRARPVAELERQGWTREQVDAVRLAYVAEVPVNWSPDLGTVLANEEVEEWQAKGHRVERRPLRQWMLRITAFAERLIDDLDDLDWPESIKLLQRNWIGRSEGAEVAFPLSDHPDLPAIAVFTTRPDTLFGATYMVLAPEHPLVAKITTADQAGAVGAYQERCASKSDLERTDLAKDKTGVFTGAHAVNPVNQQRIPVWIADYVLMSYGTGAIMAVPGHDERDFEFATTFDLPIVRVVAKPDTDPDAPLETALCEPGVAVNSPLIDGMETAEAKAAMIQWLEQHGVGRGRVQYKLRDWLFSRQRYWGEPFPIVWDQQGHHHAIGEDELPLLPPELEDFKPTGDPRGPLVKALDWIRYSDGMERETNTMPQWAGSCWYYLRYLDPRNAERFVSTAAERYWMGADTSDHPRRGGVDLYVGGTEHAVLHLLYARFWHKVLFDLGHLSTTEPFQRLVNQGLILGEDGQKMSKSVGNVINPDDVVKDYGADSLRLYEMFMGPLEQVKPWSMKGVEGVHRFLARVWRVCLQQDQETSWQLADKVAEVPDDTDPGLRKVVHETIRKVTDDIDRLSFNTAISELMKCTNAFTQAERVPASLLADFLKLLSPFAPHIAEALWDRLAAAFPMLVNAPATGADDSNACLLSEQPWPVHNPEYLIESEIELVLQVNGKTRDRIRVPADATREQIEAAAGDNPKLRQHTEGLTVRKIIVVPGRLVNVVAN